MPNCSDSIGARGTAILLLLGLLLPATGTAGTSLQSDMDEVLSADTRNGGISASVHQHDGAMLIYDLTSVAPTNSMADVFRVFLQFARAERDREFKSVQLSFRGRPRFLITGSYFKQLGEEFGTQNPVYTMRTFPENVMKLDRSQAYPTWTGGLIGVVGKQMQDFNDFHRQWWLGDLIPLAAGSQNGLTSATADPPRVTPVARTDVQPSAVVSPQLGNRGQLIPNGAVSAPPVQSNGPMQVPSWLSIFPGSKDQVKTSGGGAADVSYVAPAPQDEVVKFYRDCLSKAGAVVHIGFNGIGTTIEVTRDHQDCVIRIADADAGVTVSAKCAIEQTGYSTSSASAVPPPLPPGVHRVEYAISGSAAVVGLTYRNATGGTEQHDVSLPGSLSFNATAGQFVYLSAQNKTNSGEVHVSITVDGLILQQAMSSTPYGIASASGSVPR